MADDNRGFGTANGDSAGRPRLTPLFHWTPEAWGFAMRSRLLDAHAQHLFTSSQLRLPADATGDVRERAWAAVSGSLGVSRSALMRVRQVHGREIRVLPAARPELARGDALPDGDALVSNLAGVALAVVVADCVPVLLVDPHRGAAAAIHAGWRGTCAGVARAAVERMGAEWGTRPEDLVAAIGPSIGPDDYEVGDALVAAFEEAGHGRFIDRWFARAGGGLRLDLWRANVDQLEAVGVAASRIAVAGVSTAAHPGWLESYRRDGPAAGRLVAAIVVPHPSR